MDQIWKEKGRHIYWCWFKDFSHLDNPKIHPNMDDFHPLELDSLLHAFPSLKLITFHQTRVIGVYNECKKYVINTIIIMVFPSAKLVFRFRLSFNQILSPGLQLTPGFSNRENMLIKNSWFFRYNYNHSKGFLGNFSNLKEFSKSVH